MMYYTLWSTAPNTYCFPGPYGIGTGGRGAGPATHPEVRR